MFQNSLRSMYESLRSELSKIEECEPHIIEIITYLCEHIAARIQLIDLYPFLCIYLSSQFLSELVYKSISYSLENYKCQTWAYHFKQSNDLRTQIL